MFPVFFFTLFTSSVNCQCNQKQVFSVPITNVSLSNGASTRGIPISVGTPAQILAFQPQWPLNNTWMYDQQGQCDGIPSPSYCATLRGGLYNQQSSTTSKPADPAPVNDTGSLNQELWIRDTLSIGTKATIPDFLFGIPRQKIGGDYEPMNVLPLTSDSTLLSALKSGNHIGSKTWSMWWGLDGATAPATRDGTFVFGGYDAAKASGTNFTAPLNPTLACPSGMIVNLNDLLLSFPNGTQSSLLNKNQGGLAACLIPDWPMAIDLTYSYFQIFETLTNTVNLGRSFGTNFYGMLYDPEEVFQGDFILKLPNGLQSTIRNSQLILPDRTIDKATGQLVANYSVSELLILSLQSENSYDMPKLGRPFLSAVYLMVNLDAGTFTLWNAEATSTAENLVAVGATDCGSSATVGAESTTAPSSALSKPHTSITRGGIAGVVIGAIAALAIAAALLVLIQKRRSRAVPSTTFAGLPPIYDNNKAEIPNEPQEADGNEASCARAAKPPPAYSIPEHAVPGLHEMPERTNT